MKIGFKLKNLELTREPIKENIEPPPAQGLILPGVQAEHDIERVKSITHRFRVGYADRIGLRDSMEDKIVICGNFRNRAEEDYFAIFDGHAGKEASAYCADNMHHILESLINDQKGQDLSSCITQSFTVTHERMKTHKTEEGNFIESGTTSLIAFFQENDLFVANAGDSRAVFCKKKSSVIITEDHKPSSDRELKRITSIPGGYVLKNRVQGKLAVARAIGDYKLNPYVTETPDVYGPFNWTDPEYEFLILACDGLWDVMEEQKACDYVRRCRDPKEAAVKLRDWAYDERSKDNISVVVVWFPGFVPENPIEEPKPLKPSIPEKKESESEEEEDEEDESSEEDSEEEDDEEDEDEEEEDNKQEKVQNTEENKVEEKSNIVKKINDEESSKLDNREKEEKKEEKKEENDNQPPESDHEESSKSDRENEENGIVISRNQEPENIIEKSGGTASLHIGATTDSIESPRDHENGSGSTISIHPPISSTEKFEHPGPIISTTMVEKIEHPDPIITTTAEKIEHPDPIINTTAEKIEHLDPIIIKAEKIEHIDPIINTTAEKIEHIDPIITTKAEKIEHLDPTSTTPAEKIEHPDPIITKAEKIEHIDPIITTKAEKIEHLDPTSTPAEKIEHPDPIINTTAEKIEHLDPIITTTAQKIEHPDPIINTTAEKIEHLDPIIITTEKLEQHSEESSNTPSKSFIVKLPST